MTGGEPQDLTVTGVSAGHRRPSTRDRSQRMCERPQEAPDASFNMNVVQDPQAATGDEQILELILNPCRYHTDGRSGRAKAREAERLAVLRKARRTDGRVAQRRRSPSLFADANAANAFKKDGGGARALAALC